MILGIDPDSTHTSWAIVGKELRPLAVGVLKTARADSGTTIRQLSVALDAVFLWHGDLVEAAVVEGQQYHHGGKSPVADIIKVAQIAGGLAGCVMQKAGVKVAIPSPKDWKGSVPKRIHQPRIYQKLGLLYTSAKGYAYPSGCAELAKVAGASRLSKSDWKHVGDALGLAIYGVEALLS